MIVIQHLWTRWTKASRDASARRPRLIGPRALTVPALPERPGHAWVHDVHQVEHEEFALRDGSDWMSPDDWSRTTATTNLTWIARAGGAFDLRLYPPLEGMRQTRWPDALPAPLLVLEAGETARILWNGRFRNSMGGSNRGSFYEEHDLFVAAGDRPGATVFLDGPITRTVDLTTRIY